VLACTESMLVNTQSAVNAVSTGTRCHGTHLGVVHVPPWQSKARCKSALC
jgi:hypothetical protein